MFEYARGKHGRLSSIKIPKKEVFVKEFKFLKLRKINNKQLLQNIEKRINKVKGDFRQKEIKKIWRKNWQVVDAGVECTYVQYG